MDLAFGRDGTLYVLEIDHDGLLTPTNEGAIYSRSPRRGEKHQIKLPAGTLPYPGGLAVEDGDLYVSVDSRSRPGEGKVSEDPRTHR